MLRMLLALTGLLLVACTRSPAPDPPRVLLAVSFDTTRADALSCYASQNHWRRDFPGGLRPDPHTPVVDGLAASGLRFAWALAQAPTTLSSHTTVFSGLDPHEHRVVRNGFPVPDDVPLLAEHLREAGWDTLAVLGSSALEQRMGLDRGFRVYDDPGPQPKGGMILRDAAEVTHRALANLDERAEAGTADSPLFLFVHYFDAHTPWFTAPKSVVQAFVDPAYGGPVDGTMESIGFLSQARIRGVLTYDHARHARGLYLAQVAWMDRQLGRLLQGLDDRALLDHTAVLVFADHGETLEENPRTPYGHGPDVDLVDIHVPLIIARPGDPSFPSGVVERPVRLQDLATTLAALAGEPQELGAGRDLLEVARDPDDPPPIFAEATRPIPKEAKDRWNNLPFERAVVEGGHLFIRTPLLDDAANLYRLAPGQPPAEDPARTRRLRALLRAWDATAPAHRSVDMAPQTVEGLRALGYLDEEPSSP